MSTFILPAPARKTPVTQAYIDREKRIMKVIQLRNRGLEFKEIAEKTGVTVRHCYNIIKNRAPKLMLRTNGSRAAAQVRSEAIERLMRGEAPDEIAASLNLTLTQIANLDPRPIAQRRPQVEVKLNHLPAKVRKAVKMRREGKGYAEIAKALKVHQQSVRQWLYAHAPNLIHAHHSIETKTEMVRRMDQGEDAIALAYEIGVNTVTLEMWRRQALEGGFVDRSQAQRDQAIVDLYETGRYTTEQIGKLEGMSKQRVNQIVQKAGKGGNGLRKRISDRDAKVVEVAAQVLERYRGGVSPQALAKQHNVPAAPLYKELKRLHPANIKRIADYDVLLDLYRQGLTETEIAKRVGITQASVSHTVRRHAPELVEQRREKRRARVPLDLRATCKTIALFDADKVVAAVEGGESIASIVVRSKSTHNAIFAILKKNAPHLIGPRGVHRT